MPNIDLMVARQNACICTNLLSAFHKVKLDLKELSKIFLNWRRSDHTILHAWTCTAKCRDICQSRREEEADNSLDTGRRTFQGATIESDVFPKLQQSSWRVAASAHLWESHWVETRHSCSVAHERETGAGFWLNPLLWEVVTWLACMTHRGSPGL